jgi:hypothetical protein
MRKPTTTAGREARKGEPRGRKKFVPTAAQRATVELHTAFGTLQTDICLFVLNASGRPISIPTLEKVFALEIKRGAKSADSKVTAALFKAATGGNVSAQCFWLKCRARWRETERLEQPIALPDGDSLTAQAQAVIRLVASGTLGIGAAATLLSGLSTVAKLKEIDELTARIEKLEGISHAK